MNTVALDEEERGEFSVSILESFEDREQLAEAMRHIALLVEQGYTGGYNPSWELVDEESK